MITLITATGARPECFKLCEDYMRRQTELAHAIQWLVVDDAVPPAAITMGQEYIRGPKIWQPGYNTQRLNLDAAISKVRGDYVFVIEDDDWYAPNYLESMIALLQTYDVVGEAEATYYHIKHGCYKEMLNYKHASLCSTGFKRSVLPLFEEAVNSGEIYIDITFWDLIRGRHVKHALLCGTTPNVVGLKGLPGRAGIGVGHKPEGFVSDTANHSKLQQLIGEDYKLYADYLPKGATSGTNKKGSKNPKGDA